MKRFMSALYLATVATSAIASSAAYAQAPGPNDSDAALHGAGASSIQNVLVQELNCIAGTSTSPFGGSNKNSLGLVAGTFQAIAEPTDLLSGAFDCTSDWLKTDFNAKYVSSGSGFGRQAWRSSSNQFGGSNINPWVSINGESAWNTVQFAFADSSITDGDLTIYNTTNNIDATAGAAIMFPKYVLPVAIAYNPVYGTKPNPNPALPAIELRYQVSSPATLNDKNGNPVTVGGLRLTKTLYCGIFNGTVTNFNDAAIATANGGSLMDSQDDSTRWTNDGVPIRLVGRVDRSGTTDIFTHALKDQCGGRYTSSAESLPYNRTDANSPDFTTVRSDSGLRAASTEPTAGTPTTPVVSSDWYNPSTGTITNTGVTAAGLGGTLTRSTPVVVAGKAQGSGLFIVANGSGNVAAAINLAPDFASPSTGFTTWKLNGKIGYISADFVANSVTGVPNLFTARLENTNVGAGSYFLPSASEGVLAVGSIRPPQATAGGANAGAYNRTNENRVIRDGVTGATREDPRAWYDVLYATTGQTPLSNPADGYPLTGTTQFLGYTCYKATNAPHVIAFLGWNTDNIASGDQGGSESGIFTNSTNGLLAWSNIGALPNNWKRAVRETFLKNSSETSNSITLGSRNLWINNPTTCTGLTGR